MRIQKLSGSIKESREKENNTASIEKNKCLIEYIAMMTGVELPDDELNESSEVSEYE